MMTEKQIEDVFEIFHEQLIEKNLKFQSRQFTLENGLRVDLMFKDKNNKTVIVELKKDAITREDVGQTLQYAGLIKDSRVILVAPIISTSIKNAFEHYGIDYIEFDTKEVEKLYQKIKDKKITPQLIKEIEIPKQIIAEPLENRTKKDGNIAFKVTFVDKNWSGVCSDKIYDYNIKNRTWCKKQEKNIDNCRNKQYLNSKNLNEDIFPCYDSIALKTLSFSPGVSHGEKRDGIPKRCLDAKVGKIALFTSREVGEPENERFIFAIGQIEAIIPLENSEFGFEIFRCDKDTALEFDANNYPKYWKYYRNVNNPDRIAWNTGLFRYINDKIIREILNDIIKSKFYNNKLKKRAEYLLKFV